MKVAITGKGGVGKTTLSSTLARLYADEGRTVLAADVDPDANLGLALGLSDTGGTGCVCPEHVMLKAILSNLVFRKDDVVIMDMEAGLEHLGRGTASMMDQFIVVIEPGARSVQTYERIKSLAKDIGITKVRVVANKIRDDSDREFIRSRIPADDLLGFISYNPDVIDADRKGLSPYDCSPQALEEIRAIKARIDQE